jgi:hypothetical protein
MEIKYPLGTWVEQVYLSTEMLLSSTVMDIPFPLRVTGNNLPSSPCPYIVLFGNGTTASIPLSKMSDFIPKNPVDVNFTNSQDSLLPLFLLSKFKSYLQ